MRALTSFTTRSAIIRSRSDSSRASSHVGRPGDREVAQLGDAAAAHGDAERLGLEARAAAVGARHLPHVTLDLLAHVVRLGLAVPALQVRHRPLVVGVVGTGAAEPVAVLDVHLLRARAVQQDLLLGLGELLPRRRDSEAVGVGHRRHHPVEVLAPGPGPGGDGALVDGQVGVGDDQLGVDLVAGAEAVAVGAGAVGRVEGEVPGRQLVERRAVVGAGQVLAEGEDRRGLGAVTPSPRARSRPRPRPRPAAAPSPGSR